MIQKSYENNKPTLYIVPTPIGNLEDITYRAVKILKEVNYILAEDTRVTGLLLKHLDITSNLIACHKFNEKKVSEKVIKLLEEGNNIALVTDRGTPLISDPGLVVVQEVIKKEFNIVALPGPSAVLPALNMSGISADRFLFYGFLSNKDSAAKKELEMLKSIKFTIVLYESPFRVDKTLQNIKEIMGNCNISISREITKLHEEVFRGTVEDAIKEYNLPKGEFVIIIEPPIEETINIDDIVNEVFKEVKNGMSSKEAVKQISQKYKVSKNMLYNRYEELKK